MPDGYNTDSNVGTGLPSTMGSPASDSAGNLRSTDIQTNFPKRRQKDAETDDWLRLTGAMAKRVGEKEAYDTGYQLAKEGVFPDPQQSPFSVPSPPPPPIPPAQLKLPKGVSMDVQSKLTSFKPARAKGKGATY